MQGQELWIPPIPVLSVPCLIPQTQALMTLLLSPFCYVSLHNKGFWNDSVVETVELPGVLHPAARQTALFRSD